MYIDLSRQNIHENICWIFAEVTVYKAAVPFNGSGKKNSSYHTNINKYVLSMTKSKIKKKKIMKKPEEL